LEDSCVDMRNEDYLLDTAYLMLQGDALGPGAAMDAALARLNKAEEDVTALREAIKVQLQSDRDRREVKPMNHNLLDRIARRLEDIVGACMLPRVACNM
jgi:hypothetical protein